MRTEKELQRLQNHGFTTQGAAIVDVLWFTQTLGSQIGIVLLCNPAGIWKAYIGTLLIQRIVETAEARQIAKCGAKVPYAIAKAAFPNRPFDNTNYDLGEVQVRDGA